MRKLACSIISLFVSLSCASASFAQAKQEANSQAPMLTVTVFASSERVRFTAPASIVQMRLEVYDAAGRKLFDNELRGGNVLDWLLQDGQAVRLPSDTYLCVVTVKQRSGRLTQRLGSVRIEQNNINVQAATAPQLSAQQSAAIGPVEEHAALSVVKEDETQTATVLAHNGEEGQLVRGRGALSFRLGDFYSGKDSEQMRLTAEGKLGIGVSEPLAKLDVAGTIRTSEGIVFPDGTVQTTAYVASGRSLSERVGLQRDVPGRSVSEQDKSGSAQHLLRLAPATTPGRLAKFGGDGVTPVDTQLSESNGALVVGNAGATGNIQIFGPATADVFAGMGPDVVNGPAFNYGYAGSSFGRSAGFFNVRPDASAVAPNPSLRFLTANQQRMIITNTGNVGIGTTNPLVSLDVNGNARFTTGGSGGDFNIAAPNGETGIAIIKPNISRADVRFDGSKLYLLASMGIGPPATTNGIVINTAGNVGNVGIGTSSPTSKLHVAGTAYISGPVGIGTTAAAQQGLALFVRGPGTTSDTVALSVGNASGEVLLHVRDDGRVGIGNSGTPPASTTHACYESINNKNFTLCNSAAEYVPAIDDGSGYPAAADLVSIAPAVKNPYGDAHAPFVVTKTAKVCDDNLLGFIVDPKSGADGPQLNEHYLPLAIYGYFPAKVTTENGAIKRGDAITSSSKRGYGMKATQACKIVGYALEDATQEGTIQVFAHLSESTASPVAALRAQLEELLRAKSAETETLKAQRAALEARLIALEQSMQRNTGNKSLPAPVVP